MLVSLLIGVNMPDCVPNKVVYMCPRKHKNKSLTMETEQVLVLLRSRGDLDDGNGEAVGGRGEDGWG